MNKKYTILVLLTALVLFLLPACSKVSREVTLNNTSTPISLTVGIEIGNLAPDFNLNDLVGKTVILKELIGKPVVLTFWNVV